MKNWKLLLYSIIHIYIFLTVLDYVIYANTKLDGQINYKYIPDRKRLEITEPMIEGAVIGFEITNETIKYRVPTFGEIPLFPFYREYRSEQIPAIFRKEVAPHSFRR